MILQGDSQKKKNPNLWAPLNHVNRYQVGRHERVNLCRSWSAGSFRAEGFRSSGWISAWVAQQNQLISSGVDSSSSSSNEWDRKNSSIAILCVLTLSHVAMATRLYSSQCFILRHVFSYYWLASPLLCEDGSARRPSLCVRPQLQNATITLNEEEKSLFFPFWLLVIMLIALNSIKSCVFRKACRRCCKLKDTRAHSPPPSWLGRRL